MPSGHPGTQLTKAIQSLLEELWRVADRTGLRIVAAGDDLTIGPRGGDLVILQKAPTVQRVPGVKPSTPGPNSGKA